MSRQEKIHFFILKNALVPAARTKLKRYIETIFRSQKTALKSLNIIFCSDSYLLNINVKYLKHNYYTDTVSFDLAGPGEPVDGEIYISVDRVKDNAKQLKITHKQEIHRVIFHSVLHLCGFEDKSERQRSRMKKIENIHLGKYLGIVSQNTVSY